MPNSQRSDRRRTKTRKRSQRGTERRLTIGYLTPTIVEGANLERWRGAVDAARKRDVNLICFIGGYWGYPGPSRWANVLYELVQADNLDGLVLGNVFREDYSNADEIRGFQDRFRLPLASVRESFGEIPYVPLDNYAGMWEAVAHLVEEHGCRRIAFLRGPEGHPYAEERYRAYTDALEAYGVPLDPEIVAPPSNWGEPAIEALLDERGLRPGLDFEAVVSVSDLKALAALRTFRERGVRVPADVAVVGFDDRAEGEFSIPPLTSVRPPFYEQGRQAIELVLAQLRGEDIPQQIPLPATLTVRQSCGCAPPAVLQAAVGAVEAGQEKLASVLTSRRDTIIAGMAQAAEEPGPERAAQLLNAFVADLTPEPGRDSRTSFPSVLDEALQQTITDDGKVSAWHGAISVMRRHLLPHLGDELLPRADDLWQQARVLIGEAAQRAQTIRGQRAEKEAEILREIGQSLITTFDVRELVGLLAQGLPRLGIPSAYISLYEDPQDPAAWARLILAYDERGPVELEPEGRRFRSPQLVPEGMLPQQRPYCLLVESLHFREDRIGFALFEVGPRDGNVYQVLQGDLSSALQGALLLQARGLAEAALKQAYAEVEQQVQDRTAELRREIAERERAQEENIRLQQEVIEAQKKALLELSTPIIPITERIIVMPLIGSIETMRAREIMRAVLAGIRQHRAKVLIMDITGVPVVDTAVALHLNKTIQAARLKGARTIVTGVSDEVAETIVDLGIDWSGVETLADLQTGLAAAVRGANRKG